MKQDIGCFEATELSIEIGDRVGSNPLYIGTVHPLAGLVVVVDTEGEREDRMILLQRRDVVPAGLGAGLINPGIAETLLGVLIELRDSNQRFRPKTSSKKVLCLRN